VRFFVFVVRADGRDLQPGPYDASRHGKPDGQEDCGSRADRHDSSTGYAAPDNARGSDSSSARACPNNACGNVRAARLYSADDLLPPQ